MPTVASIAQLPASVNTALIHTARPIPMPLAVPAPDTPRDSLLSKSAI